MEDLELHSLFFAEIVLSAGLALFFTVRLYLLHCCRIAAGKSFQLVKNKELPLFYSSYYLKQGCLRIFFRCRLSQTGRLAQLASRNPYKAAPLIRQKLRLHPQNWQLQLLYAEISLLANCRQDFQHLIERTKLPFYAPKALKASFLRLTALSELYNTDMLSASKHASMALKLYQKSGFAFEQGECYLALAQIYRISGIFDVAFAMLQEAEKIFSRLQINAKIAEAKAYVGLLELGRENYAAALEYLQSAEDICISARLAATRANIMNWQGMIHFLQQDYAAAQKLFSIAKKEGKTEEAKAFSAEMLARACFKRGDCATALQNIKTALFFYRQKGDISGVFENLYLKAEIFYARAEYGQSAKILTKLIKNKFPPRATFYPANAYTLLGLINLKLNRLNAAETLFKQAADLENSQNRIRGAAVDYNNLAETSLRRGEKGNAQLYLQQALAYAETLEDEELKSYFKKKLNSNEP